VDRNDLKAFLAVAEQQSFSRAAVHLKLTQPAVSKRIRALELNLGVRLFDRVGKRVYLTDPGRLLKPRAEAILRQLTDTQTLLRNLHGQVDGVLSLATSHHVGLHRLAPVLRTFSRQYGEVRLDIRFVDSEVAHDMVHAADAELAVVTLDPAASRRLRYQPLWRDPLTFVASRDHPLASARNITLRDLTRHAPILPGTGTFTGRIVIETFRAAGLDLAASMSTNYLETIAMLVGIGLGWSVLPVSLLAAPMVALDVRCPQLARTLGCVTNPERTPSNAARAFVEVLEGYADGKEASHAGF